jgi:hypothetical protein
MGCSGAQPVERCPRANLHNPMGLDIVFLRDDVTEPLIGEHWHNLSDEL